MRKPFKMKYTNGKKADMSSFPFKVEAPKPGDTPLEAWDWSSAGSGASKGAMGGAMVGGPWGAVIGGVVGGVAGGVMGGKEKEEAAAEATKIASIESENAIKANEQRKKGQIEKDAASQVEAGNKLFEKDKPKEVVNQKASEGLV